MFERERFYMLIGEHADGEVEPLENWSTADLELLSDLVRDELDARLQEDLNEYDTDDDQ